VVLEKGVHGNLQCSEIPGEYTRERLRVYGLSQELPHEPSANLLVWQKAHQFVLGVYSFTAAFPKPETYGLSLQMRRAAVSIPANIAEGFRRRGKADKSALHEYRGRIA